MKRLRWLLAFVFFCAVDFANPLAAAPHETSESMEEGVHVAGHRRVSRVETPDRRAPRVVLGRATDAGPRAGTRAAANQHRGARTPARKVPPPVTDSLSSSAPADDPDAH
jgi:hypothetical protein